MRLCYFTGEQTKVQKEDGSNLKACGKQLVDRGFQLWTPEHCTGLLLAPNSGAGLCTVMPLALSGSPVSLYEDHSPPPLLQRAEDPSLTFPVDLVPFQMQK